MIIALRLALYRGRERSKHSVHCISVVVLLFPMPHVVNRDKQKKKERSLTDFSPNASIVAGEDSAR